MKLSIFVASTATLLATSTLAADICAYSTRGCTGTYGCCSNIPAGTCCTFPSGSTYGWGVKFSNMAGSWFGTTYGDTCSTSTSGVGGTGGSVCSSVYNAPGYINWRSANWKVTSAKEASVVERSADTACVSADTVGYTDDLGVEHSYHVGSDGFEAAIKELEEGHLTSFSA